MGDVEMTDAEQACDPFAEWRPHKRHILSILARGDPGEINRLRQAYTATYGEDIAKALDSEEGGFDILVVLCLFEAAVRDAHLANRAILKEDTDVLIEIACSRSPQQLLLAKQAYCALYKKSLEEDCALYKKSLEEDVAQPGSGICRELVVPLLSSNRYPGLEVDMNLAEAEAKILYERISKKDYSNGDVIWILATRSKAQLKATLDHYKHAFKKDFGKDLKADPDNQFLHVLRTAVKCLIHPEKYFEKVLRVAINAQDKDVGAIARVLSTRAMVDMNLIIERYARKNGFLRLPQL